MGKQVLSCRELALILGLSESTVRRLCDGGELKSSRTAGGHRRIARRDAAAFIHARQLPVVRPDLLSLQTAGATKNAGDSGERLAQALQLGDGGAVESLVKALHLEGMTTAQIFDGPLRQAMQQIGELWPQDERGIFVEHRATMLCVEAVAHLRGQLPQPDARAMSAIGGAAPGDPYVLPSAMAACVLAEVGFKVANLGPNTPFDVLVDAAREVHATLIWIAITSKRSTRTLSEEVGEIARHAAKFDAHVVLGGSGAAAVRPGKLNNVIILNSMTELMAFARGKITTPRGLARCEEEDNLS